MSKRIVDHAIISRVMLLFTHVDMPSRFPRKKVFQILNDAITIKDVYETWKLFRNYSVTDVKRTSGPYYQDICTYLESVDGLVEEIQRHGKIPCTGTEIGR